MGGRSGERNWRSLRPAARARTSAARYPLRTAPSMVAGHPVAVQSPARKTRGHVVIGGGSVGVDAGTRGVGGVDFLDHRGFHEIGFAGGGEEFADFAEGEVDDFGAGFVDQGFGGADDEFDVAAARRGSIILSLLRGFFVLPGPTACAVGCILTLLRS